MNLRTVGLSAMAVALVAAVPGIANAFGATSMDEATKMAAEHNVPILLEFGTEW
jgi:hypothetical protein